MATLWTISDASASTLGSASRFDGGPRALSGPVSEATLRGRDPSGPRPAARHAQRRAPQGEDPQSDADVASSPQAWRARNAGRRVPAAVSAALRLVHRTIRSR